MRLQRIKTGWFFLKYSLVKPDALPCFKEAVHNQHLPLEELDGLNWQRTQSLLEYAYKHVPYYRDKFSAMGLNPADISTPEHFAQVPLLTRDDVKANAERLISSEARPRDLKVVTTGGSTGQPLKVYHQRKVVRSAMLWRVLDWWGLPPDVNVASIYRSLHSNWSAELLDRLVWWPTRRILLDAGSLDEASIRRFILRVQRVKPELIHAYVGALDHVADYMLQTGTKVPTPKAIWSTCSPLTAVQERNIQAAFGGPVFDHYGCSEVYWLSAQCPAKEGLHRFHDVVRIEFLDDAGRPVPTGEWGRIAITDLQNRYFPLIRYLNGDRGRALPEQCSCGMTLPLMDRVKGRVSEAIRLRDGTTMAGEFLTTIFDDEPEAVRQFQVVQRRDYSVDIVVVPNAAHPACKQVLEAVRARLSKKLKDSVPVRVNLVASLPAQAGKLHFVRSELGT